MLESINRLMRHNGTESVLVIFKLSNCCVTIDQEKQRLHTCERTACNSERFAVFVYKSEATSFNLNNQGPLFDHNGRIAPIVA